MKTGEIVTKKWLKDQYDSYSTSVLSDYLEPLPKARREWQKYKVKKDLPTKDEYKGIKTLKYTTTVGNLIGDAFGEIESLGEEMREAYENTPESLQQGDVGERRGQAADDLENLAYDVPDVPDVVDRLIVVFYPSLNSGDSRPRRASEAASMLTEAVDAIREFIEDPEGKVVLEEGEEIDKDELGQLADSLENMAGELEAVDFPGMFG